MSYRWQQTRKFTFSSYSRSGIFRFCADYLWAQAFVFNSVLIFCKVDASLSEKRWFRGCFDALNPPNRGIPNFGSVLNFNFWIVSDFGLSHVFCHTEVHHGCDNRGRIRKTPENSVSSRARSYLYKKSKIIENKRLSSKIQSIKDDKKSLIKRQIILKKSRY